MRRNSVGGCSKELYIPRSLVTHLQQVLDILIASSSKKGVLEAASVSHPELKQVRLSGAFWAVNSQSLLRRNCQEVVGVWKYVKSCYRSTGGFGGSSEMDMSDIVSTVCGLQTILLLGKEDEFATLDENRTYDWILRCKDPGKTFFLRDPYESPATFDMRFQLAAVCSLSLLNRISKTANAKFESPLLNKKNSQALTDKIKSCRTIDGSYGAAPGDECHAGHVFCALSTLKHIKTLGDINASDRQKTVDWLKRRIQKDIKNSQLCLVSGRPGKKEDVCYAFWVLGSLALLGESVIPYRNSVGSWILRCFDPGTGSFQKSRKETTKSSFFKNSNWSEQYDLYHTHFALCALSLLGNVSLADLDIPTVLASQTDHAF
eukprot:GHVP01037456.1.p1 GENE.GHVP01037456.1~~GHVP01037456.1.p1  ORF type:complete len:375 (-),score=52.27 GHVP01037456.1:849-1973(-)